MNWRNSRGFVRPTVVAALLAATLASSAPVARWCPMPWDRVPPAMYLRCALFATSAPARYALTSTCAGSSCCPAEKRARAYCLTDPGLSSVWRRHVPKPRNPSATVAVLTAALALAAPEPALLRARGLEPEARPPSADPASRPPVRGPPFRAAFA
jgi:hypothetical protein